MSKKKKKEGGEWLCWCVSHSDYADMSLKQSQFTKVIFTRLITDLSPQGLLVVVVCWTIMELLSGVLRASPDASPLNIDIYIYL